MPDRGQQISVLYHAALTRPAGERLAFLIEACGADEVLRQDIESLLDYESASVKFLETPAVEAIAGAVGGAIGGSLMVGRQLGPYTFVAPLGTGGMGEVYRARDSRLGRDVAIKILPSAFMSDSERRSRFAREGRLLATLNHPHIGAIYGSEEIDGITALVLELVEGPTLADRLSRGPLPVSEALAIARQIAEALDAAHEKGIVHRDLKPANVVVQGATNAAGSPSGKARAKVLDFGLAKTIVAGLEGDLTQRPSGSLHSTAVGRILGTPAYMSPEQTRGQEVDRRTDIWAFGCVLYEMLSGRRAFHGDTIGDTFVSILERDPDWTALPASTPADVRALLERCLRKDVRQRLPDIADALIALENGTTPTGSSGPTANLAPVPGRSGGGRRGWMVGAAVALALVAAIATGVGWYRPEGQRPAAVATLSSTPVDRRLSRLTFDAGMQTDVSFSSDGRSIAYASDRAGNFDIWTQPVDGGEAKQITRAPAQETEPAWSPDGRRIVFRTDRGHGGLSIVPAHGGQERELTTFGVQPVWSPDGTEILFRTPVATDQHSGIFTVSPEGGTPRALLSDIVGGGYWNQIAPHPDGRISLLGSNPNLSPPIKFGFHTVSRDGRVVVTSTAMKDLPLPFLDVVRFQWNSAGTALYVEAVRQGVRNVWRVRVDPMTLDWVAAERLTTGPGPDSGLALSSSGARLAFTTEQRLSRLWMFPLDAAGRLTGKGTPFTPEENRADDAVLSPDGRFVTYHLVRTGRARDELMLTDLDANKTELFAVDAPSSVAWSPDSRRLAYAHRPFPDSPPPREWELVVREVGGPERVTRPGSTTSVLMPSDWTPDGHFILGSLVSPLARATVPAKLSLWPTLPSAAPIDQLALADGQGSLWRARLSPNGQWLAFLQEKERPDEALRLELYVARPHSARTEWTRIVPHHRRIDKPRWSSDGNMLYFISSEGASYSNLWAIRFDSAQGVPIGEPFKVTSIDSPDLMVPPEAVVGAEIGISSRRAILTLETVRGSIWMLESVDR